MIMFKLFNKKYKMRHNKKYMIFPISGLLISYLQWIIKNNPLHVIETSNNKINSKKIKSK